MKNNKFIFLLILGLGFFVNESILAQKKEHLAPEFSFGIIADCQYNNVVGKSERKYSLSNDKLEKCITHFNTMDLEYVIHLGDFIDKDFNNFDVLNPIFSKLKMPGYHVLGNHDFSVQDDLKKKVPQKMGLKSRYYDFEVKGWRFIVLDGNDISFHAYPENSAKFKEASKYFTEHHVTSPKWNGAIGSDQINWLKEVLDKSSKNKEKVVLFSHFPIYPENMHNLWNASEIITLIENYSNVKAFINGHNHVGNYESKKDKHYLTLKAMVDTNESSYSVVKVFKDHLQIVGYGREKSRILKIID